MSDTFCCCLPLETKVRDLDARLYLAALCVDRGFTALVGSKSGVLHHMFELDDPFIFIPKGFGLTPVFRRIRNRGSYTAMLDEEGSVFEEGNVWMDKEDGSEFPFMSRFFAWGRSTMEAMLEKRAGEIDPDRVLLTGHPRFDLASPRFSNYFRKLRATRMEPLGPYVLINSSFTHANPQMPFEQECEFRRQVLGDRFYDHEYEVDHFAYRRLLIKHYRKAVEEMSHRHSEATIVYRPHPAEDIDFYRNAFADLPNVLVSWDGSVQEWIVDASLVIHHDCTTAIESFMHRRRVVSYSPLLDWDYVQAVPVRISDLVTDNDELMDRVDQALALKDPSLPEEEFRERSPVITEIIDNVDGGAADKIADDLAEIAARGRGPVTPETPPSFAAKVRNYTASKLRSARHREDPGVARRVRLKFPGLDPDEVALRLDLLREALPALPEMKAEPLSADTYLIRRKA